MLKNLTRRGFLQGTAAGSLAGIGLAGGAFWPGGQARASAAELVAVEWGGPWIENAKALTAKQDAADIQWELHAGGAAAIVAKIKAVWPNAKYDMVAAWDPVYLSMMREGWLEPITEEDVPNLANVPKKLLFTDADGNVINVPRTIAGIYWGYRKDIAPFEIKSVDDLFDPRLKGQICFPDPVMNTNLQTASLALANGGSEHDMEPGWELLKELAKSGNIGRVAHNEVEFINSMMTGETSVAFWSQGGWNAVEKEFPCTYMTRVPDDKAMKAFFYQEGWTVLKSSENKAAAKEYINFFIDAENLSPYCAAMGFAPANTKAAGPDTLQHVQFAADEFDRFAYVPDWEHMSTTVDASVKRFETDIIPLL